MRHTAGDPSSMESQLSNSEFERDWVRAPMPTCQGSCGQPICTEPIVSEGTITAVLIDGMWSGPTD